MAKYFIKNPQCTINSVDLSDHIRELDLDLSRSSIDDTTSGAEGLGRLAGLRDEKVTVKWAQDFDMSLVDATLWAIHIAGASVPISAAGDSGDSWEGDVILTDYVPLTGAINSLAEATTTFEVDGVLTRSGS